MGSLLKSREVLPLFRFLVRLKFFLKMDFPYKQLTPKGQIKVNEGQMESLFDLEKDEDFSEDNIIRDILCLSTIDKISQSDIDKYKVEKITIASTKAHSGKSHPNSKTSPEAIERLYEAISVKNKSNKNFQTFIFLSSSSSRLK